MITSLKTYLYQVLSSCSYLIHVYAHCRVTILEQRILQPIQWFISSRNILRLILIDLHFICDVVLAKTLHVRYICSVDQHAYLLTRGASSTRFCYLRSKLYLASDIQSKGDVIVYGRPIHLLMSWPIHS